MTARWLLLFLAVAAAPWPAWPEGEGAPRAECVSAGRPARLAACVYGTDATGEARLFFRNPKEPHWYFVEATHENGCASGVIPAPGARLERVAYYVEIATASGTPEKSRERTARVVRSPGQCVSGRLLPSSPVEPSFVGATAGAPLTPSAFGPQASAGGAPGWVLGSAAAAAAGGTAVAIRGGGAEAAESREAAAAPRAPSSPPVAPPAPTATPEPPSAPAPAPAPRRNTPEPTPEPTAEPPLPPPPAPLPSLPVPTPKLTPTPKPPEAPKPTATPKPRRDRDRDDDDDDDFARAFVHWRGDLQAPGARGRLVIAHERGAAAEAPGGRSEGTLALEPGENRLEISVVGATAPGLWRVTLGGPGLLAGTLRALTGNVTIEGGDTVVLRLRGPAGDSALVAFRSPTATPK